MSGETQNTRTCVAGAVSKCSPSDHYTIKALRPLAEPAMATRTSHKEVQELRPKLWSVREFVNVQKRVIDSSSHSLLP